MGFDVDYTDLEEMRMVRSRDVNLFYDPVTGYNLDPNKFGRPNPAYGQIQWLTSDGRTQTRNIASSFTRRFKNNFQGGVTYTRSLRKNDDTTGFGSFADNQFNPGGDWSQSSDFQRDTLRANGIVNLPWQMTLAGSFFYGSGSHYNAASSTTPFGKPGTNRLNIGAPIVIPAAMLDRWEGDPVIATGTVWPRNALRRAPAAQGRPAPDQPHQGLQQPEGRAAGRSVQRVQLRRTTAATTRRSRRRRSGCRRRTRATRTSRARASSVSA